MDINNLGQVVGSTYDREGRPQLFLYDDGEYVAITGLPDNVADFQGHSVVHGPATVGINDLGHIAGTYVKRVPCETCGVEDEPGFTFIRHGFVATPKKVGAANQKRILRRVLRALERIDKGSTHLESITQVPVR